MKKKILQELSLRAKLKDGFVEVSVVREYDGAIFSRQIPIKFDDEVSAEAIQSSKED